MIKKEVVGVKSKTISAPISEAPPQIDNSHRSSANAITPAAKEPQLHWWFASGQWGECVSNFLHFLLMLVYGRIESNPIGSGTPARTVQGRPNEHIAREDEARESSNPSTIPAQGAPVSRSRKKSTPTIAVSAPGAEEITTESAKAAPISTKSRKKVAGKRPTKEPVRWIISEPGSPIPF